MTVSRRGFLLGAGAASALLAIDAAHALAPSRSP
jgi:hypothetical protein